MHVYNRIIHRFHIFVKGKALGTPLSWVAHAYPRAVFRKTASAA